MSTSILWEVIGALELHYICKYLSTMFFETNVAKMTLPVSKNIEKSIQSL